MCPVNKEEYLSRRIPLIAYMFATLILEVFATNETSVNMNNSSRCIQAVPAVSEFSRNNSSIFYKYTLDGFCKDIITSLYVFGDQRTIAYGENQINALQFYYRFLTIGQKCAPLLIDLYCRYHFPPCDTTLENPRKRRICRRSCNHVLDVLCKRGMDLVRQGAITAPGFDHDKINCSTYPVASGGEGPECYQFSSLPDDDTRSTGMQKKVRLQYLFSLRLEDYDGLAMSAEWVRKDFPKPYHNGGLKRRGRCRTRWIDAVERNAKLAGIDQDLESMAASKAQWRDMLALLVS